MLLHVGATWQIQLNDPWAAAMRPYVKLLFPLDRPIFPTIFLLFRFGAVKIWQSYKQEVGCLVEESARQTTSLFPKTINKGGGLLSRITSFLHRSYPSCPRVRGPRLALCHHPSTNTAT